MKKVRVKKDMLMETLKTNRELHIAEYEKAKAEFREAGITALEELLEQFKADKTDSLHVPLSAPDSHEQEYDDAIKMLEMSCDDVIELDEPEAQSLIMNNWHWSGQLCHTRALYAQYLKKN